MGIKKETLADLRLELTDEQWQEVMRRAKEMKNDALWLLLNRYA